jgi:hypothetical protein
MSRSADCAPARLGVEYDATMTTPRDVTETVPDSIAAREPAAIAHIVQRDRVRASLIAVPDERGDGATFTPEPDYRAA